MNIEKRLKELGLELPETSTPMANYVPSVKAGTMIFLSGHGPGSGDGKLFKGRLGKDLTVDDGYATARQVALKLISTLKQSLGDLDRVRRIVKLTGFVNSSPDFTDQPKVINGASDLFVEVFGDKGKHARSAIGMVSLPNGIPVEIELIAEIDPE